MNEAAHLNSDAEPSTDRINPVVFYSSAIGIVAFAVWTMFFTASAQNVINVALGWISDTFGWFYFLAVLLYLAFVLVTGKEHTPVAADTASQGALVLYRRGVFMNLTNPKVSVFFLAFLPQFVDPGQGSVAGQLAAAIDLMQQSAEPAEPPNSTSARSVYCL